MVTEQEIIAALKNAALDPAKKEVADKVLLDLSQDCLCCKTDDQLVAIMDYIKSLGLL